MAIKETANDVVGESNSDGWSTMIEDIINALLGYFWSLTHELTKELLDWMKEFL
jgi:hypothetical protein